MNKRFIFLLLPLIFLFSSCKECIDIELHRFNSEFLILPEQRTYAIGDTLKFKSNVPFSHVFGEKPVATRFNLHCFLGISEFQVDSLKSINAFDDFEIFPIIGSVENGGRYFYDVIDTNYVLEVAIIPKSQGFFEIFYNELSGNVKNGGDCERYQNFYSIININADNHVEWKDSIVGYPTILAEQHKGYFFEVQ